MKTDQNKMAPFLKRSRDEAWTIGFISGFCMAGIIALLAWILSMGIVPK